MNNDSEVLLTTLKSVPVCLLNPLALFPIKPYVCTSLMVLAVHLIDFPPKLSEASDHFHQKIN